MAGMENHAKKSEYKEFAETVQTISNLVCGLVEAAAQAAHLIGVSEASSATGHPGLVHQVVCTSSPVHPGCLSAIDHSDNRPTAGIHFLSEILCYIPYFIFTFIFIIYFLFLLVYIMFP